MGLALGLPGQLASVSAPSGPGVSIKQFGTVGNGGDDTTVIQNAINTMASTGGLLYFPRGTYRASNLNLTALNSDFSKSLTILGDGPQETSFSQLTGATGNFFDISGANNLRFKSLSIQPGPNSATAMLATRLSGVSQNCNGHIFDDVWFTGSTSKCLLVAIGVESTVFRNCRFDNGSATGSIYWSSHNNISASSAFGTILQGFSCTDNNFDTCRFTSSITNGVCIYLSENGGVRFSGCSTHNTGAGAWFAHVNVDAPQTHQFGWTTIFDGCHFEGNGNVFNFTSNSPTRNVYQSFKIVNNVCINSGYKWVNTGATISHNNLTFENNTGGYPVELADVQQSRISHFETGATIVLSGAADACSIRAADGGITGSALCSHVEYYNLFSNNGKNFDQYGAGTGAQARVIRYVPTTTAPVASNLQEGVLMLAKPPGWDPLARGGTDSYFTRWTGAAWGNP